MLITALAAVLALAAPEGSFVLQGKVLDPTRAPVPSARVEAISSGAQSAATTQTDTKGEFTLALPRGRYTVKVLAPGFLESTLPVDTEQPSAAAPEFVLKVARFGESVTVRALGPYQVAAISSATKTLTPLRDVPQSVTVTTKELVRDQLMLSVGDVMRYTPGIQVHQGENNRDQVIIRGNSTSADFFVNGVRDDVQYYRDLYNLDRVEALKGPNSMMFGRGGGGGVVNRVTKDAVFRSVREVTVQGGAYGHKRIAGDFNHAPNEKLAFRLNGMYDNTNSFRDDVELERYAFNPTLTIAPSSNTRFTLGYEHLHDTRVADRGITSYQGQPADVDISTFYGNPADSHVRAGVDLATATVEHKMGHLTLRNRTMFGAYDRFYQNYVPGAVTADKSRVALTAYNNATERDNLFNQTDLVYPAATGRVKHVLLAGVEVGRQGTDNFRNTGYFNGTATIFAAPYENPTITTPVTYHQSATDADNHLTTKVAAAYLQDQVELSSKLQVVGGLRFDRFDLTYENNRNGDVLDRVDNLVSPRVGVVYKPVIPVSVYGSYTVSYLPSSGDQFSSLTVITEQVKPEKFNNYELGIKWEPHSGIALTSALYRLDRTNTRATDPSDPTRIVQTGSQRTNGFELGVNGRVNSAWRIAGGYAYQDAFVTSATAAAKAGAHVPQVPHHTFSLWNHYQLGARLGAAIGLQYRTDMFATIDNTVTLEGYTRVDLAAFYTVSKDLRIQANLENAFDKKYWINADSNTNISPGSGVALRIALTAAF